MIDLEQANRLAKQQLVVALQGKGAHLTFEEAVKDFPPALYNGHSEEVPYTLWHQIEHIRIAQWDILNYVVDPTHESPSWPKGYWPDQSAVADEKVWESSIERYYADRADLIALVQREDVNVLEPVIHNAGRSMLGSMIIITDHTSYHLGEFVMVRQMLGAWKSELT